MSERRVYNLQRDAADERDFRFSAIVQPFVRTKLPKKVDLRTKCPSVYNQLNLGSCTAHAGTAARTLLLGNKSLDLSELYLYYMERFLEGTIEQDGGATMRSICKVLQKYGVCEERYMPYIPAQFAKAPTQEAHENAGDYKVTAYRSIASVQQIKECLALRQQPVMIGMNIFESFETIGTDGKLPLPVQGEQSLGGHAVLVVGYEDKTTIGSLFCKKTTGYLTVRNSWGPSWGDGGYFYMPYEYVTKGYAWDFWTLE